MEVAELPREHMDSNSNLIGTKLCMTHIAIYRGKTASLLCTKNGFWIYCIHSLNFVAI